MDLLPVLEEARLHRGVAIAMLRSALSGAVTHKAFAARMGRSREYLEYLLREDGNHTPGPETARLMAMHAPLPVGQQQELREHLMLSGKSRLRARRAARDLTAGGEPAGVLDTLRTAHWEALHAADPSRARLAYALLHELASALLERSGRHVHPLDLVETCLLLHDVESVLDRPGAALYHARFAGALLRRLDPGRGRRDQERLDHFAVNAPYAEVVTLTTLRLPRQAGEQLNRALAEADQHPSAKGFWLPHLYRHQLAITTGLPRFSQHQVNTVADQARQALEGRDDPINPRTNLLIDMSLARGYLRYEPQSSSERVQRKAYDLLRPHVENLERIPYLGPLHRVVVLSTFARICWAGNRRDEWTDAVGRALSLATLAGLGHQERRLRETYGTALDSLPFAPDADRFNQ